MNRISVSACTDVGRKRPKNEDACLVLSLDGEKSYEGSMAATLNPGPLGVVLAVADGMGGHQSGEVASALSIQSLSREFFARMSRRKLPVDNPQVLLAEAVQEANKAVYAAAAREPGLHGMGTTLTVAWLVGATVELAHVGDSRAYLVRGSELIPLTEDQTVGNLLDLEHSHAIVSHQLRSMLTQAVGAQPRVSVALSHHSLAPGDLLMVCCDGLYKAVEDEEMKRVLSLPASLKARAEGLVACANENGGPDNITVVLAELLAGNA